MAADLTIIVVHYRTPDILARSLARLAHSEPGARVLLVDTAPDPEVLALAATLHPGLEVLRAPNHSLANAVNVGLKEARTPFVAHMNADVFVEPDTFRRLLDVLEAHPEAGVAAPLPLTPAGRRQDHGPLYRAHYLRLALAGEPSVPVPWLPGCLHLLRREVVARCGGLDPSLRFYNEDMEFCLRARAAGYACRLARAPVTHLGGSSTPHAAPFLVEGIRGGYQISRRYLPRPLRAGHRAALAAWGATGARLARSGAWREAMAAVRAMARDGDFDESPFGDTLDDRTLARRPRP